MTGHDFELLARRRDGPLDAAEERKLAAHVATCATCRAYAIELENNDSRIARAAAGRVTIPPFERIGERTRGPWRELAVAAGAVLIVAVAALAPALFGPAPEREVAAAWPQSTTTLALPAGITTASPGGEGIVVADGTSVVLVDASGGLIARHEGGATVLRWLPDGSGVLLSAGSELAVLDRSGLITLGVSLAVDAYAYASLDGRQVAAQVSPAELVVVDRGGGSRARAALSPGDSLVGWHPDGSVLVASAAELRALTADGSSRWSVALPAIGRNVRTVLSPDRAVVLLIGSAGSWAIRDRAFERVPDGLRWIAGHELLDRAADGRLFAVDALTGASRPLPLTLEPLAAVRGTTDGFAVLSPERGDQLLVDLDSGAQRRLPELRRTDAVERLGGSRLLVTGDRTRVIDAREAFR